MSILEIENESLFLRKQIVGGLLRSISRSKKLRKQKVGGRVRDIFRHFSDVFWVHFSVEMLGILGVEILGVRGSYFMMEIYRFWCV